MCIVTGYPQRTLCPPFVQRKYCGYGGAFSCPCTHKTLPVLSALSLHIELPATNICLFMWYYLSSSHISDVFVFSWVWSYYNVYWLFLQKTSFPTTSPACWPPETQKPTVSTPHLGEKSLNSLWTVSLSMSIPHFKCSVKWSVLKLKVIISAFFFHKTCTQESFWEWQTPGYVHFSFIIVIGTVTNKVLFNGLHLTFLKH